MPKAIVRMANESLEALKQHSSILDLCEQATIGTEQAPDRRKFKIYIIRNTVNGKVYVGKTSKTIEHRWKAHINCSKRELDYHFHRAIRKYGPEAFVLQELDETDDQNTANVLEMAYIQIAMSTDSRYGYNRTFGGDGVLATPETLAKMSKSLKGKPILPAQRKQISERHSQARHHNYKHGLPIPEIIELYNSGLCAKEIGRKFGVKYDIILRRLRFSGVKIRSLSETFRQPTVRLQRSNSAKARKRGRSK